ncbi:hypothetical protein BDV27DRAFT_146966 [Aspergillus caelatus]|uniref:Uncharacterized protein n=1 Tax=Aspergillus caelatus TaxID=61420 RepID=A0A5N6ZZW9_9EURO|nr:uncharacterized protein BDV27DRAFT_146966 [Aspergillus caelatus]KAE8362466.1 hypothetical protein BDV27DRAFT_146966 [Aspergillus caelatus]
MRLARHYDIFFFCENGETRAGSLRCTCLYEEEGWQEYLQESLAYTCDAYVRHYGPLSEELLFLIFAQSSNRRFPSGPMPRTITELLARGRETGRPVVLVINGWDDLSMNPIVLVDLFERWMNEVNITLRVFAGDPRKFFEVSVVNAIEAIRGDHEDDDEAPALPSDTKTFVDRPTLTVIMILSEAKSPSSELGDAEYGASIEDSP